jgi:hypothetical protein
MKILAPLSLAEGEFGLTPKHSVTRHLLLAPAKPPRFHLAI